MAWRSGSIPGVGAYLVLPAWSAAMAASLMNCGVSKSGSPAAKLQTSSPAASMALAFASMARVGDGETFWAQTDSGCGLLIGRELSARGFRTQASPWGPGCHRYLVGRTVPGEPRLVRRTRPTSALRALLATLRLRWLRQLLRL